RDLAILRMTAVELAAEPLLSLAELIAALYTRRARAALDAILDDDPVAFLPSGHAWPEARHFAGDVESQDAWQRAGRRAAGANAEVRVIQRRPSDADDDLARPRLWVRSVAEDELVRASRFSDVDGFHAGHTSP